MNSKSEGAGAPASWFVGASYGGTEDQTPRFLKEGIWVNGSQARYLDAVKSIQAGDRIAIKSSYTRKRNLDFDNRGQTVSVMAIKAIGTVKENLGDGHTLKVDWKPFDPPREWFFYTNRNTVWRVLPGDWMTDALIGFTFEGKQQDTGRFRNAPYWRDRFGDSAVDKRRFGWTRFYEAYNSVFPFRIASVNSASLASRFPRRLRLASSTSGNTSWITLMTCSIASSFASLGLQNLSTEGRSSL